jgi:hypothetical protein
VLSRPGAGTTMLLLPLSEDATASFAGTKVA